MSLRGVVSADWHIGGMSKVFPNGGATTLQIAEIHKVYKYAADNAIRHVFIPGDISDKTVLTEHDLIALISLFLWYDDHFDSYYMAGNHDFHSVDVETKDGETKVTSKTSLDVLKLLVDNGMLKRFKIFYEPEMLKLDGVNVCFMPFPHQNVLAASRPPLVMAHIEVAGAIGDNGRVLKSGNDHRFIRQSGDFVMSGHIHLYQYLKAKRFAYCGSLYQKNFGESLPKGFIDFEAKYVKGALRVSHEFVSTKPGFTLQQKLIQESSDWESLVHDPTIRYKILTGEGVVVPKNVMKDFPNIVYLQGASATAKVKMDGTLDMTGTLTVQDLPKFNTRTGLTGYLKAAELNTQQIRRAKSLVAEALSHLGLR
jgi:hypothetical protein